MDTYLLLMPSGYEVVVVLLVIALLFGGKKIPELMRGLGKGMGEFRKASSGLGDVNKEINNAAVDLDKSSRKEKPGKTGNAKKGPDEKKSNK